MIDAVRAFMAADGRLVSADAELLRLQEAAGGNLGSSLVLPALDRLARLSLRLHAPIERPVVMADERNEFIAHGRFFPESGGIRIELVDWLARPLTPVDSPTPPEALPRRIVPPGVVQWACDIRLRLVMVQADAAWGLAERGWLARPMSELFHLVPDDDGQFALLGGLSAQADFAGQAARMAVGPAHGAILQLHARAMRDEAGVFTGFFGEAVPAGFGQLPPEVANPEQEGVIGAPTNLLGSLDTRTFAMKVDSALRRPLGRIVANAETISAQLQGPIRADYARYASDIALAGRHLLDLVDDLADLQAVDRDNFTIASEPVDLADVARRAAGLLAVKARESGQRIVAPQMDEHALATGEFRRVLQILLNLVGNAIRYGPDGGQVWLCVDSGEGQVSITVADQGPGISLENQARLFTKFERLGRTDAGGSGLGLYISRRLALAMGGDISVDSAPGQGARFTLTLPARAAG